MENELRISELKKELRELEESNNVNTISQDLRTRLIEKKQELVSIESQLNELKMEPSVETRASAATGQLLFIPSILAMVGASIAQATYKDWKGDSIFSPIMFLFFLGACLVLIMIGSNAITKSKNNVMIFEEKRKELNSGILELRKQIIELETDFN